MDTSIKENKYVAYYRVSTKRQGESGLGLEAQKQSISSFLRNSDELIDDFVEIESGSRNDRPQLLAAIECCRRHRATLIIAKLDRLARNVAFVSNLMESGIDFIATDMPSANKLTVHILAAVAEHEREMISQRTKAALAAAKARGVKLGNPNGNALELDKARSCMIDNAKKHAANVLPLIRDIQHAGLVTYRQIAKALNVRGIPSARGGQWHPATVRNIMLRTSVLGMAALLFLAPDHVSAGQNAAKMCAFSGVQQVAQLMPKAKIVKVNYSDDPQPQDIGGNAYNGEVDVEVANLKGTFSYSCITLDREDSSVYKTYVSMK
jgi:DNA invertase Pin-like site-specific DNA recombinase